MSEVILPIPDDIRHLVLTLWGVDAYETAMSNKHPLLGDASVRECIATGRLAEVRQVLRALADGAYL